MDISSTTDNMKVTDSGLKTMLNMNQLRAFYEVIRTSGFTNAGKRLNVTQPAITAQIRALEKACGFKLIVRKGRYIYPTEEGKTIFELTKKIFKTEEEIENLIDELRKLKKGTLRLGSARTYRRYFLPYLINFFHKFYPNIKVLLDEGSSLEMVNSIIDGRNHLAIISRPTNNDKVDFLPLCYDELVLILSPRHQFAGKKRLSIKEISNDQIIMKESGSGTRRLVEDLFKKHGISPKIIMATSDAETIKTLVELNEGISFLVKMAVKEELRQGKLITIPISGEKPMLEISIGFHKRSKQSPSANAFLELIKEHLSKNAPYTSLEEFVKHLIPDPASLNKSNLYHVDSNS